MEKRDLRRAYRRADVATLVAGLQDDRAAIRARAAHLLGYFAGTRSVSALIGALNDPNRDVRQEALRSLAWIADPQAVPAIAAVALSDPSPELRSTAALRLEKIGSADAVSALIETLDDPARGVRMSALKSLGRTADERAIARVAELAVSDPALGPSNYATETLAKLGDPRAAPLLLSLLTETDRHLANGRYRTVWPQGSPRLFELLWHHDAVRRNLQKWAAKQLVELDAVEVAPEVASAATTARSRRERRLLRRTARRLQRT